MYEYNNPHLFLCRSHADYNIEFDKIISLVKHLLHTHEQIINIYYEIERSHMIHVPVLSTD